MGRAGPVPECRRVARRKANAETMLPPGAMDAPGGFLRSETVSDTFCDRGQRSDRAFG